MNRAAHRSPLPRNMASAALMQAVAPAKLNLSLHVHGKRADGYHELESLVAFTQFGDVLSFAAAETLSLTTSGEFAGGAGDNEHNLVMRAARALQHETSTVHGASIQLQKNIPVGAGLGGGSSDAAVTLKMLRALWGVAVPDSVLHDIAASLGADVPMCIAAKPLIARGRGEQLSPLPYDLPPLFAVLVYPQVALATAAVFGAYTAPDHLPKIAWNALGTHSILPSLSLAKNSLQRAAISQCSAVGEILIALETSVHQPELVRMSGSGSCCFALFNDASRAQACVADIKKRYPQWWVASSALLT